MQFITNGKWLNFGAQLPVSLAQFCTEINTSADDLGFADRVAAILMMSVTFIALALIAVNFALLNIAAWVYLFAGIFLLGFGGSRWTSDIAINYYRQILNLGLQLMTMILLMSMGQTFIDGLVSTSESLQLFNFVVFLIIGITLSILSTKLPPMVGNITGTNTPHIGFTAQNAASAVVTAGLMLAGGAGMLKKALHNLSKQFKQAKQKQSGQL